MSDSHPVSSGSFWFGRSPLPQAIMAWGFRAIFKQGKEYPLDIIPDRQGHQFADDQMREYQQFAGFINEKVIPELQRVTKWIATDSSEVFTLHFEWPHDTMLVVVAEGSPQSSYGYLYGGVNLVPKEKAPAIKEPEWILQERRSEERRARLNREIAEQEAFQRQHWREMRDVEKRRKAKFSEEYEKAPKKRVGEPLVKGDGIYVDANQGNRDAIVRAVIADRALVEYQMPAGKTFLRQIAIGNWADMGQVSPNKIPKKWQTAMNA